MAGQNRTMELDRLFVRDIFFKDKSNQPISANKILTTRGDGGIYFGVNLPNNNFPSFNEFRAGANKQVAADNAYNTLWLEEGAGIRFFNIVDGLQPKTYISATAPEQITIEGSGETLHFSSLRNTLVGGRTLYYRSEGDTLLRVSDTTLIFGSAYNSSYSSLQLITSSAIGLLQHNSTVQANILLTLSTVDLLLVSTALSTFYSTLMYNKRTVETTSTFLFSTFLVGEGGATTLNIGNLNTGLMSSLLVRTAVIDTNRILLGSNIFTESNLIDSNADMCTAFTSTGTVSTYTNYLNIQDTYTGAKLGFEKNYLYSQSSFGPGRFETHGYQYRLGMYPLMSTQGGMLPPSQRDLFYPAVEQTEILEKFVIGSASTLTKYMIKTTGKFDEICSRSNLEFTAPNISMKTLTVEKIVSANPFSSELISTFSTIYISTAFLQNARISTLNNVTQITDRLRVGQVSSQMISSMSTYTDALEFKYAEGVLLDATQIEFQTATGTTLNTTYANFTTATGPNVSTQNVATTFLRFDSGSGSNLSLTDLSTLNVSTNALRYNLANGNILNTSNLSTVNLSANTVRYGTANGVVTNTLTLSTGTLGFQTASGSLASISNLSTINISTNAISFNMGYVNGFTANDMSTNNLSTGALRYGLANGNILNTSNLSALNLSVGAARFDLANGYLLNTSNLSALNLSVGAARFDLANGYLLNTSNLSALNISVGAMRYDLANGNILNTSNLSAINISTNAFRFALANGGTLNTSNLSALNLSVGAARFDLANGYLLNTSNLSALNISVGAVRFDLANGYLLNTSNVSAINISTNAFRFALANGGTLNTSNLSALNLSVGAARFDLANGNILNTSNLSAINISTNTLGFAAAAGSNLAVRTLSSGALAFGSATGNTMTVSSINTYMINVINVSSYNVSTVNAFFTNIDYSTIEGHYTGTNILSTGQLNMYAGTAVTFDARTASMSNAYISSLSVSSIRGVVFPSTYSTLFWSTATGINATVSTMRLSTVMGNTDTIFKFDMENRRVGVNLGVTRQPRATVDVNGVVYADNFVTTSDRRLKSSIRPVHFDASAIPNSYLYTSDETGQEDIGVLADEIEAFAPHCVYTRPDGLKAVSYTKLVPVCLSLIKSMAERLELL